DGGGLRRGQARVSPLWARRLDRGAGYQRGGAHLRAPSVDRVGVQLGHRFEQERPGVKIRGGAPLLIDVAVDALDLFGREPELRGDLRCRQSVILSPQDEIELRVVNREVEVLL